MATCAESLSLDRSQLHSCSPACVPVSSLYHRMRNALQSLANCAFLLARDPGISPENAPLLSQMQADVATVSVLLRRIEPPPALSNLDSLITRKGEL
jgi:hypothetical protein